MGSVEFKRKLVDQLVAELTAEIEKLKAGFQEARQTAIESPGRMQSRYDTMGVEAAWVATGLSKTIHEKQQALASIKNLRTDPIPDRITIGSLVGVGREDSQVRSYYFIVPSAGGITLALAELPAPIRTLTIGAPAAIALVGRDVGDEVRMPGVSMTEVVLSLM